MYAFCFHGVCVVRGARCRCACAVLQLVRHGAVRRLPQAIRDKYATCEVHTFMGLFPEIDRAFVVFDNQLMIWNYKHNDVDTTFSELDQVIVSVALVVPRPDAFNDFVKVRPAPSLPAPGAAGGRWPDTIAPADRVAAPVRASDCDVGASGAAGGDVRRW